MLGKCDPFVDVILCFYLFEFLIDESVQLILLLGFDDGCLLANNQGDWHVEYHVFVLSLDEVVVNEVDEGYACISIFH